ncbi:TlpA disulfide reductase family protein [Pedobacter sp. Hv1]|uniref:TlpA family protein disulfide reductase n=1 Tax=Pedobacter sp. Hv1 TaxID=1740090 RepID=UPI0006D8A0D5|nr:TlpA disulfide reductase family protein [Pedobacter sp. Hv1]KQC00065.1 hypothetical protein AQF98_13950 [Pedobacter sp. Hv1]
MKKLITVFALAMASLTLAAQQNSVGNGKIKMQIGNTSNSPTEQKKDSPEKTNRNTEGKITLTLQLKSLPTDSVSIYYQILSNPDIEVEHTAQLKNGMLKYEVNINEPIKLMIMPLSLIHKFKNGKFYPTRGSRITCYANPGDQMKIEATLVDSCLLFTVKGNKVSEQYALFHNETLDVSKDQIAQAFIFETKKENERSNEEVSNYQKIRNNNLRMQEVKAIKFIKQHPNYEASALLMKSIPKDSVISFYGSLTPEVKKSFFGKEVQRLMNGWFNNTVGKKMPEFEANTIENKSFKLSNTKGKYVLLDFWGSWCKPCLDESPQMKALQLKYQQELQIVGLIANDTKENAIKAIKQYQLNWTQLFSETNEFGSLFGLREYPTKILIDPAGVVVQIHKGSSDQVFKDIEALISKTK